MKILDFINEKSNNAYKDFKLVSVIFDEKLLTCTFKFLYKDTIRDEDRVILHDLIAEYIGKKEVTIVVKCKRAYIDRDLVADVIYNFISKNYSSICIDFSKENLSVNIVDNEIDVSISVTPFQRDYILNNSIDKEITQYANSFFFEPFSLSIENTCETSNDELDLPTIDIDLSDKSEKHFKYNRLENITPFVGEVSGNAIQINCIKEPLTDIEIAGKIKFINEKSFVSKRKDKEGNSIQKVYYGFSLQDSSGKMNCVYFPNKADLIKFQSMTEDSSIVVAGDVEDFNGRINFKVKSIAYCDIVEEEQVEEVVEEVKAVNDKYYYVFPEPYVEMFQDNLFIEKQEIGDYLNNNDVVVFDIETTGLEATKCEIIEIGAVKLHKGKIVETFETLIKPNSPIPDEITNLTGITDEMVANSPNLRQVIPDFYKFCYGTTIMAYNIDFDYKFISIHGKKLGYIFDNKQIDVLYLARAFVVGLKNFKLSTVCKKLGVSLENAHRAVHDAMATAEVVIKLNTNITEN